MRRSLLLASCAPLVVAPRAFFNTNSGAKLYVCATAQQSDLSQADYEALAWVQVKSVGSHGESGSKTNILTYDTWDNDVVQKGKGMTDGGSPEIELARIPTDAGQNILRAAAKVNLNYAFKIVRNDPIVPGGVGTVIYNRGLVVGPARKNGRNEDFDLETFTLGLNQREIVVDPLAPGNAPQLTVAPVIDDTTPNANQLINVNNGTFTGDAPLSYTYQWYAGGQPIDGATGSGLVVPASAVGKVLTCRVRAANNSGAAIGYTAPTTAVAA